MINRHLRILMIYLTTTGAFVALLPVLCHGNTLEPEPDTKITTDMTSNVPPTFALENENPTTAVAFVTSSVLDLKYDPSITLNYSKCDTDIILHELSQRSGYYFFCDKIVGDSAIELLSNRHKLSEILRHLIISRANKWNIHAIPGTRAIVIISSHTYLSSPERFMSLPVLEPDPLVELTLKRVDVHKLVAELSDQTEYIIRVDSSLDDKTTSDSMNDSNFKDAKAVRNFKHPNWHRNYVTVQRGRQRLSYVLFSLALQGDWIIYPVPETKEIILMDEKTYNNK